FTFYVNDKQVGSGNDFKIAYLFDLLPFLKPGENEFIVDAVNNLAGNIAPTSTEPPPGSDSPAGMLFYGRLRHLDHGVQRTNDIASDSTWLCSDTVQTPWQNGSSARAASGPSDIGSAARTASSDMANPSIAWTKASKLGDPGMIPWRVTRS